MTWGAIIPATEPVEGSNERCVELPLAVEVIRQMPPCSWVLDAGCSLNLPKLGGLQWRIMHVTQNLESENVFRPSAWRSYASADLRDLSVFADGAFDATLCVSTLEHVGMDNSGYEAPAEERPETRWRAIQELARVTKRVMLLTMPYEGVGRASWQPFSAADVAKLPGEKRYYVQNEHGWYGGGTEPMPEEPIRAKVKQIVCVRIGL